MDKADGTAGQTAGEVAAAGSSSARCCAAHVPASDPRSMRSTPIGLYRWKMPLAHGRRCLPHASRSGRIRPCRRCG